MKILFIFHEAERTGATLNLLSMVRWLTENSQISTSFLVREDGVLVNEMKKLGPVFLWDQKGAQRGNSVLQRVTTYLSRGIRHRMIYQKLRMQKFDLLYANSIGSSEIIRFLKRLNSKKIWHIHELDLSVRVNGEYRFEVAKDVDFFIANSNSTRNYLRKRGMDESRIKIFSPVLDTAAIENVGNCDTLKRELGIPEDSFIIGSAGTGIDRKGLGTFIQLKAVIDFLLPGNGFCYVWIGKVLDEAVYRYDIQQMGAQGRIFLAGEIENPGPYYRLFNIYVSCSKEESFGMSAMESAALGKPVVCFEGSGGLAEWVKEAGGLTVPYLDIVEMAKKVIELHADRVLAAELGLRGLEYSKKLDINAKMPEFLDILKSMVK